MQKLIGYLIDQKQTVVYSPDSTVEHRNRTVYSRPLKAYRGIKNTLQLQLKDSDQKPVVITGKTFVFNIFVYKNFNNIGVFFFILIFNI